MQKKTVYREGWEDSRKEIWQMSRSWYTRVLASTWLVSEAPLLLCGDFVFLMLCRKRQSDNLTTYKLTTKNLSKSEQVDKVWLLLRSEPAWMDLHHWQSFNVRTCWLELLLEDGGCIQRLLEYDYTCWFEMQTSDVEFHSSPSDTLKSSDRNQKCQSCRGARGKVTGTAKWYFSGEYDGGELTELFW